MNEVTNISDSEVDRIFDQIRRSRSLDHNWERDHSADKRMMYWPITFAYTDDASDTTYEFCSLHEYLGGGYWAATTEDGDWIMISNEKIKNIRI